MPSFLRIAQRNLTVPTPELHARKTEISSRSPLTQSSNPNENYKQQLTLFIFCVKIFLRLKRKFFLHACCPCQHRKRQSCSPFRLFFRHLAGCHLNCQLRKAFSCQHAGKKLPRFISFSVSNAVRHAASLNPFRQGSPICAHAHADILPILSGQHIQKAGIR